MKVCEDFLEICFIGIVVGRNYAWCLFVVVIFMGFGQAEAKRCEGCLKVNTCGWRCRSQKWGMGGSFHRESRLSLCNTAVV